MNEFEIAQALVLPYIRETLKWPEKLHSTYGRVPVQIGGSVVWADFVCYIFKDQRVAPWLVFEVKKPGITVEETVPQAESYSLILGSPFFCVTDGYEFTFYMTRGSQGSSIRLETLPARPIKEYLKDPTEHITFPHEIDNLLELFLNGLKQIGRAHV